MVKTRLGHKYLLRNSHLHASLVLHAWGRLFSYFVHVYHNFLSSSQWFCVVLSSLRVGGGGTSWKYLSPYPARPDPKVNFRISRGGGREGGGGGVCCRVRKLDREGVGGWVGGILTGMHDVFTQPQKLRIAKKSWSESPVPKSQSSRYLMRSNKTKCGNLQTPSVAVRAKADSCRCKCVLSARAIGMTKCITLVTPTTRRRTTI